MKKKVKSSKLLFLIIFFPLVVMAVGFSLFCNNPGFNVQKISSKLVYNDNWGTPPLNADEVSYFVKNTFSQPFYYLGSGEQCYAFQSEDGRFVLKFFKMHQLLPKEWLNSFPFFLFESYRFNHVEKKKQLIKQVFTSIKISYDRLRSQTGILFVHLNKTRDFKTKVTLFDKAGKKYLVDLDSKEFLLQKRVVKIYDHLVALMKQEEEERVHQCIRSLFKVVIDRCKQGLADLDIGVRNNYGFLGDDAIIIDCGGFILDDAMKQPHLYEREILRIAEAMDHWARSHCMELIPIIHDEAHLATRSIFESQSH
jgi:hypothetical protein